MISELVIGTHNKGKFPEICDILKEYDIKLLSGFEYSEPEETGSTFEENALIKARHYRTESGKPALSDDSGLCVKALGDFPGINSARFAKEHGGFGSSFKEIWSRLEGYDYWSAKFVCALAISISEIEEYVVRGEVHGTIVKPARGENGFGFDPIFVPNGYDKTFAELGSEIKDKISHRAEAFKKLAEYL